LSTNRTALDSTCRGRTQTLVSFQKLLARMCGRDPQHLLLTIRHGLVHSTRLGCRSGRCAYMCWCGQPRTNLSVELLRQARDDGWALLCCCCCSCRHLHLPRCGWQLTGLCCCLSLP
jgi:hypothetical protein